jgi:hypothetical protein
MLRGESVSGRRVRMQALLGWAAGRAGIATIRERDQPRAIGKDFAQARNAQCQDVTVAMKVEDNELARLRGHVPDDHLLTIRRVKNVLVGWKPDCGRRGTHRLRRKIQQLPLHNV